MPRNSSAVLETSAAQAKRNARMRARSCVAAALRDAAYSRAQRSRDAARHAQRNIAFRRARSVCVFSSMPSEIDTAPIVRLCRALKKRVWHIVQHSAPRSMEACEGSQKNRARAMGASAGPQKSPAKKFRLKNETLSIARWARGISYGGGLGPCVVFVPGLAFSARGARLGRGGGFYDRFLERLSGRARTVGLCFDCQVECKMAEDIPEEAHDMRVDAVLTERGF